MVFLISNIKPLTEKSHIAFEREKIKIRELDWIQVCFRRNQLYNWSSYLVVSLIIINYNRMPLKLIASRKNWQFPLKFGPTSSIFPTYTKRE